MGLLGNNVRTHFGAQRQWGTAFANTPGNYSGYNSHVYTQTQEGATTVLSGSAIPLGGYPPATFFPPQISGEISIRQIGDGDLTADLYPSRSMSIDITGSGTLTADAALVISMICNMTGSGTLSASIVGLLNMSINLTGSGNIDANLSAIGNMVLALTGTGGLEATIAAYGNMSIDIVVTGTGLSTENVGQAVWSEVIESGYAAAEILRILAGVVAGKSSGQPAAPIYRNLADTKDRVSGAVDGSGNRTNVTIDKT